MKPHVVQGAIEHEPARQHSTQRVGGPRHGASGPDVEGIHRDVHRQQPCDGARQINGAGDAERRARARDAGVVECHRRAVDDETVEIPAAPLDASRQRSAPGRREYRVAEDVAHEREVERRHRQGEVANLRPPPSRDSEAAGEMRRRGPDIEA